MFMALLQIVSVRDRDRKDVLKEPSKLICGLKALADNIQLRLDGTLAALLAFTATHLIPRKEGLNGLPNGLLGVHAWPPACSLELAYVK